MEKIFKLIKRVEKAEKKYGNTIPKPISNDIIEDFKTKFILVMMTQKVYQFMKTRKNRIII